jgi:hypothetical protein
MSVKSNIRIIHFFEVNDVLVLNHLVSTEWFNHLQIGH